MGTQANCNKHGRTETGHSYGFMDGFSEHKVSALLTEIFTRSVMSDDLLYAVNMYCFYWLMNKTVLAYDRAEYG